MHRNTIVTQASQSRASSAANLGEMARPLRIEFPGALYHVIARGNERKPIVRDDGDRESWLGAVERASSRFALEIRAYCLMNNHYHLLLGTLRANLSRALRELNGAFAQRFNRRHGRSGHLFGGRYKAILVEREPHLLELSRYIVLNPARVAVASASYESWPWSSYRATAGLAPAPGFLRPELVLAKFADEPATARRRYRRFVREGLDEAQPQVRSGIYLGSDGFIRRVRGSRVVSAEIPRAQSTPLECSLEELLRGQSEQAMRTAYCEHGYRLREIARVLGVHYSTVSRRLKAEEAEARTR